MPKIAVFDMSGKELETMELSDAVFGIEPNVSVMHDMVKNYLANQRQGTQSALTRAEAVSYTHLDVYKRQRYHRRGRYFRRKRAV